MKPSLSPIASPSHDNALPESPEAKPRLSRPAQSGVAVGSKRSAASAELDALSPRLSTASLSAEGSTGPAHKRPRLTIDELARKAARPSMKNESSSPAAPTTPASEMPSTDAPEPHPPSRHFDAHQSHHLDDIMHRLRTLHHDYGEHLTPAAAEQLRHEIRQLHDVAKQVLDVKRRLMRRMK